MLNFPDSLQVHIHKVVPGDRGDFSTRVRMQASRLAAAVHSHHTALYAVSGWMGPHLERGYPGCQKLIRSTTRGLSPSCHTCKSAQPSPPLVPHHRLWAAVDTRGSHPVSQALVSLENRNCPVARNERGEVDAPRARSYHQTLCTCPAPTCGPRHRRGFCILQE